MLESLLYIILRLLLSPVIDLSSTSLNLSIWSGSFTLTNLAVRRSFLERIGLKGGFWGGVVGKVELEVPWRDLWRRRIKILVSDVDFSGYLRGGEILDDVLDDIRT
jgi:vacuolar protein sorting-associated protein 13A/C